MTVALRVTGLYGHVMEGNRVMISANAEQPNKNHNFTLSGRVSKAAHTLVKAK